MINGYAERTVDKQTRLLELREVTFSLNPEALREIAGFLVAMADQIEAGRFSTDHRHIGEVVRGWDKRHPKHDIIVAASP
jgi:hypothetical protein